MSEIKETLLHKKLSGIGFSPKHAAEVGVYKPETSNIYSYIIQGCRCTLVEPDPHSCSLINDMFSEQRNITLHQVALCDFSGNVELVQRDASTFVSTIQSSPSIVNDEYDIQEKDKFTVVAKTFNEIDDGSIDLISIDTEGSEWFVIKHMVSRPEVISIETHGALYTNPYIREITNWMKENQYSIWYIDKSDSVYIKNTTFFPGMLDKLKLYLHKSYLFLTKTRKRIKRNIRKIFIK